MSERESTKLRELKEAAHTLYQRGRYGQCVETYTQLARLLPHDANVRIRLAEACRRAGQRDQAITAYREAAKVLLSLGCESRARGALKAALELDPRDPVLQLEVVRMGQGAVSSTALEDEQLYTSANDFFDRLPPTPPPTYARFIPPPPPPAFVLNAALDPVPAGGMPVIPPIAPIPASEARSAAPAKMPANSSGPGRGALLPHHRPAAPAAAPARAPETATETLARSIANLPAGEPTRTPNPAGPAAHAAPVPGIAPVTPPAKAPSPGPVPHIAPVTPPVSAANPARAPGPGPVPHIAPVTTPVSAANPARASSAPPLPAANPTQCPGTNATHAPGTARTPPPSPSANAAQQKALPGALLALPALPQMNPAALTPVKGPVAPPVSKPSLPPERPTVRVIALLNRAPEALPTPPPPAPLPRSQVGHPHASSLTMPPLATLPYRPEMRRLAPNVVALRVSPQARWVIIRSDSDLQVSRSEALPGEPVAAH